MNQMTELEAINQMLLDIRMAPVATADDLEVYHEATIARQVLLAKSREVQSRGWNYNTHRLRLSPDVDGHLLVPGDTIDAFVPQGDDEIRLVNNRVTDVITNSNEYTESRDVFVVLGYPIEELPAPIQNLCLAEARLRFVSSMRSDGQIPRDLQKELTDVKALACAWDLRQKRRSMLDTLKVSSHVNRNYPRR